LGANDGAISTASLVVGVAAAHATYHAILVAGVAGLAAGAMSMAAGEYVSVSSQSDTERADLVRERRELDTEPRQERDELAGIYVSRGLTPDLAKEVADQLTAHDALSAHARDELGISDTLSARPVQAAFASAGAFIVGAALPLLATAASPVGYVVPVVVGSTLIVLAGLGASAAVVGGAPARVGAARVVLWGAMAMGITAAVGALFRVSL
jgi:VIT1/CCC1 family predicted Fe2+/Mn2+ transporter